MTITVTGKNLDLGDALRDYVLDRVDQAVEKYFNRPVSGQILVEKSHGEFSTSCSLHLHSGFDVQTSGSAADAYASVDVASAKLEKQLRRYKRHLKNHHAHGSAKEPHIDVINYVIDNSEPDESSEDNEDLAPPIIAEHITAIKHLSVSDAVMQLDLSNSPVVVFRNASHGQINFIYRRPDGNIGWIDPAASSLKKDGN
ncbi:MAG: ribosome-associated translation inhibitor RaiA [Hyphomicrobiales bacterium]|nr:ribosome-associated translation inhibitor RaiA [Hyphomicrobiales bacterium]